MCYCQDMRSWRTRSSGWRKTASKQLYQFVWQQDYVNAKRLLLAQEKLRLKSEKEAAEAKFKFALVDGRKEQVILGSSSYGHGVLKEGWRSSNTVLLKDVAVDTFEISGFGSDAHDFWRLLSVLLVTNCRKEVELIYC